MSDSDKTVPSGASATLHVEAARVRGSEPSAAFAPTGPSAERDFFAERLALFARIACLASTGFLIMRVVLNAVAQRSARHAPLERFPVFHLVATLILLLIWLLAGSRGLSNRGLRRLDAAGTIAAAIAYSVMAWTMPISWRPDQLVLLILNAVLLGRAALVPSEPRRTAWIALLTLELMPVISSATSTPGLASSKAAPSSSKASVSDAAANTVIDPSSPDVASVVVEELPDSSADFSSSPQPTSNAINATEPATASAARNERSCMGDALPG